MASLTIATLCGLDDRYALCGACCACRTMRPLDLRTLLGWLGAVFRSSQVRFRIRCQDCGGPECETRLAWIGNGTSAASRPLH